MTKRDPAENKASADLVVYQDERYTLGRMAGRSCLIAGGRGLLLSCHPFEPCLYITEEDGTMTVVRNAFDPETVLESFQNNEKIRSISGREYDARDFCRLVEYAAGKGQIGIDEAEAVFRADGEKKEPEQKEAVLRSDFETVHPEVRWIINDDPAYDLIDEYEDRMVDFCLVKSDPAQTGPDAHRQALTMACRVMFFDGEEQIWRYDCAAAEGHPISVGEFLAPATEERCVNYRGAFLYLPFGGCYSEKDFDRVNAALFPNGTDGLEIYEWTTDWSEYFDEGHEWWGTLCLTVYDKTLNRFTVILASGTD